MSGTGNLLPGSVVPRTGEYKCESCGEGGTADLMAKGLAGSGLGLNTSLLQAAGRQKAGKFFEARRTFLQCPTCGPATGWTLVEQVDEPGLAVSWTDKCSAAEKVTDIPPFVRQTRKAIPFGIPLLFPIPLAVLAGGVTEKLGSTVGRCRHRALAIFVAVLAATAAWTSQHIFDYAASRREAFDTAAAEAPYANSQATAFIEVIYEVWAEVD